MSWTRVVPLRLPLEGEICWAHFDVPKYAAESADFECLALMDWNCGSERIPHQDVVTSRDANDLKSLAQ